MYGFVCRFLCEGCTAAAKQSGENEKDGDSEEIQQANIQ